MEVDLFSFSPSLLEIVTLIHPKDIPNCLLVSKRLSGVITRNRHLVRRLSANMRLTSTRPIPAILVGREASVYVSVVIDGTTHESIVVHHYGTEVRWWYHRNCINRYYADNGIEKEVIPVPGEYNLFRTRGVAHGLRLLVRYFFQRYHFTGIEFTEDNDRGISSSPDYCQIVCEEFSQCRSKCDTLHLHIWLGPNTHCFYNQLECERIWILVKSDLDEVLEAIPNWDRNMGMILEPDTFESFEAIVDLLKNWESGWFITVKSVMIYQRLHHGMFIWDASEVIEMLSDMQCVAVKRLKRRGVEDYFVEIYIRRSIDDRILGFRYSKQERRLFIEEVKEYTGLEEQLCIAARHTVFKEVNQTGFPQ